MTAKGKHVDKGGRWTSKTPENLCPKCWGKLLEITGTVSGQVQTICTSTGCDYMEVRA